MTESVLVTAWIYHGGVWREVANGRMDVKGDNVTRRIAVESLSAWLINYLAPSTPDYPNNPTHVIGGARFSSHGMVYADASGSERKLSTGG